MKQIIVLIISGLVVTGCCSTRNDIQQSATSDLQLRRYELKHCLSMARTSWDKEVWQSNAYGDVRADFEEKQAIEGEITRRRVTNYHWSPPLAYPYRRDHCHCEDWIVTL